MYGIKGESSRGFYALGAERLAEELGFRGKYDLENWAEEYPEYWGNEDGLFMFDNEGAFDKELNENLCLTDIADWYMEVAERLRGEA